MKANNLTISLPYSGCNKSCPYCVSKMTGYLKENRDLFFKNIPKVKRLAKAAQVSSVLFTSKGEPLKNTSDLFKVLDHFWKFPIEIQTNGLLLTKNIINDLIIGTVNVVAISIDNMETLYKLCNEISHMTEKGILVRVTVNLVKDIYNNYKPYEIMDRCKELGIDQLSFRQITSPNQIADHLHAVKARQWIIDNIDSNEVSNFIETFRGTLEGNYAMVRKLTFGATVFDYKGLSVTYMDTCLQEVSGTDDLRSLIYQEDGHLYTSWNSSASKLF